MLATIDWLRRAVQELSSHASGLETQLMEERQRSQQLARDCQSDLRVAREKIEKAEAKSARLEGETEEKSHQLIKAKAELEAAVQKVVQFRDQAQELVRAEREALQMREASIKDLERRNKELTRGRLELEEKLLARDKAIEAHRAEIERLRQDAVRIRSLFPLQDMLAHKEIEIGRLRAELARVDSDHPSRPVIEEAIARVMRSRDQLQRTFGSN